MSSHLFIKLSLVVFLLTPTLACTKPVNSNNKECASTNVHGSLICYLKKNQILKKDLEKQNNNTRPDFKQWEKFIKEKCVSNISYSQGDGGGLIKESCRYELYKARLKDIQKKQSSNLTSIKINDDGFNITELPYKSSNHISCIENQNQKICKENLHILDHQKVLTTFNMLGITYGSPVILPTTTDGTKIIISPFTDEGEELVFFITLINKFGVPHEYSYYSNVTFDIDKNFNLKVYDKKGKLLKSQKIINGELK